MPKYVTAAGLRMRVGSPIYRWYLRNRARLLGDEPKPKPFSPKRAAKVLRLASHFIGVKEYPAGSNLQMFGKWFGENGVAWCAIFVSYVLSHAGRPFKQAYVPTIVALARSSRFGLRVISASEVNATLARGIPVLTCFDWTGDGTADHVGFAKHVAGGMVHTVEGNTGDSNWSNGGEVLPEVRALSLVQAFVAVGNL